MTTLSPLFFLELSFLLLLSCKANQPQTIRPYSDAPTYIEDPCSLEQNSYTAVDTITLDNIADLQTSCRNNRIVIINEGTYPLASPLVLDSMVNLTIKGRLGTNLVNQSTQRSCIRITNSIGVTLSNLAVTNLGQQHNGDHGAISIQDSKDIAISKSTIRGGKTIGVHAKNVCNLIISDSKLTECSMLTFEFDHCKSVRVSQSTFTNNHLFTSVLGGFTNGTTDVTISDCTFSHNTPDRSGNPIFNFYENDQDTSDKVVFHKCIFRDNKGFKWYKDKITLDQCTIID